MPSATAIFSSGVVLALCTLVGACTGRGAQPRGAAAATRLAGTLPHGPAEPGHGLPMPSLDVRWTPPMLTAGDLEALRASLASDASVALHVGARFEGPEWSARVRSLVRALRPHATVVGRLEDRGPFAGLALPLRRVEDRHQGRRPHYDWSEGALTGMDGASAVLVLDDAEVEPGAWGALPARTVGSCAEPMAALAAGQEQSLAELEPFLDHADAVLWQVYRAALATTVPRLAEELEPYAASRTRADFDDGGTWERYQCGHTYWEYLQPFARCGEEAASCPSAPRVFLMGGVRIGSTEPSVYLPGNCAAKVGRDHVIELRKIASEAAEVAQEHLAPSWVALADRLGAVTEVYETLEDVCAPRRRRFADPDLEAMRDRLASIGVALASDEMAHPAGYWELAHQPFHVPGHGPVQQVAIYRAGPGSPSEAVLAEARALRELGLRRALCRSGQPGLPLAAALVDGASGQVEFFGYFFEEELFCGDLPPLWRASETLEPR